MAPLAAYGASAVAMVAGVKQLQEQNSNQQKLI